MTERRDEGVRVFVLDDHELIRQGLRDFIDAEEDLQVAGEASTAAEALARIPAVLPDVAIVDVRLPDGDGIEVCRTLRSSHPDIRLLILTSFSNDDAVLDAIVAGASGYLIKDMAPRELIQAIRRVAGGQSLLDPAVTERVLETLRHRDEVEPLGRLNEREREILDALADGLTNREIAQRVHLSEKTVKNYVSSLLSKLGLQHRTQAALFATEFRKGRGVAAEKSRPGT